MSEEIHNLLKIQNDKTTIFTNQELKMIDDYIKELEAYKYNMDRDYLRLEKENKILRENAENNGKVVDNVNWENMLLKKENEQLKDNWNELKEWASNFYNSEEVGWAGCGMRYTLEKMQEIERSDSDE